LENIKISIFGGDSKFLELIVFGQILVVLGSLRQFWVDFAALTMVDSVPELWLKS
jgi:hypothetical protein